MQDLTPEMVIYEQPLNERMRAFLRLEHLFERAEFQLRGQDEWSNRAALEAIIDVLALLNRADLKTELIKELERHATTLEALERDPRVDRQRLVSILSRVRDNLETLRGLEYPFGFELKHNELLTAIQQRSSIPAGTCDFDLPTFRFWLHSPPDRRSRELREWFSAFRVVREAVALSLALVRESAVATPERARGGFFQKNLDTANPCQLVRVAVPAGARCYSEISAGKHRFTVRFMRQDSTASRPSQIDEDVEFELLCCVI